MHETKTKQKFIANAQTYNQAWPDTYELMRDVTSKYVLLKSMAIGADHKTDQHDGLCAPTRWSSRKWWIALKNRKDIFDNVTMQIPTHPLRARHGKWAGRRSGVRRAGRLSRFGRHRPFRWPMGSHGQVRRFRWLRRFRRLSGGSGGFPGGGGGAAR